MRVEEIHIDKGMFPGISIIHITVYSSLDYCPETTAGDMIHLLILFDVAIPRLIFHIIMRVILNPISRVISTQRGLIRPYGLIDLGQHCFL